MNFEEIVNKIDYKKKAILIHSNADMDALGSAYAIAHTLSGPADIVALNSIDRIAKVVAEKLKIPYLEEYDPSLYECTVVVDTSSPDQLGKETSLPADTVIIDHHISQGKWEFPSFYCDDTKTSCCEIIKEMLDSTGKEYNRDVALALLGGMLTDSGHFQFAKPPVFRAFADLLERFDIGVDEALNLTKAQMNMSERVAVMKTCQNAKFERIGNFIVATAIGSTYESSGCRALISAGADVSFVCSQREDSFRLSARATQDMVRRGVNVGNIISELGFETDTEGGGHGGAAGLNGTGDAEAMLNMCMAKTADLFRIFKSEDNSA